MKDEQCKTCLFLDQQKELFCCRVHELSVAVAELLKNIPFFDVHDCECAYYIENPGMFEAEEEAQKAVRASECRVCERITDANKDIFWTFARTHQFEHKEEFVPVPARFCPACGREIGKETV